MLNAAQTGSKQWGKWHLLLFAIFLVLYWLISIQHYDLFIAYRGFSPVVWVSHITHPEWYVQDFPNGTHIFAKSAFMHLYLWANQFHILPEQLYPFIVLFEITAMAIASIVFSRWLFPDAPKTMALVFTSLVIASFARDLSLSRFSEPFFVGQYYNAAEACRILAIVCCLARRLLPGCVFLALAAIIHPIYGLTGGLFILAGLSATRFAVNKKQLFWCAIIVLLITGGWVFLTYRPDELTSQGIPANMWFALTRLTSSHWYPVARGLFGAMFDERLFQYLGFFLLFFYALKKKPSQTIADKQMGMGMIVMMSLVLLGIIFSVTTPSTTLVKLALHRSDDLVLFVALAYMVNTLWKETLSGSKPHQILALALLTVPFVMDPPFPLLLIGALFLWEGLQKQSRPALSSKYIRLLSAFLIIGTTMVLWLNAHFHKKTFWPEAIVGPAELLTVFGCVAGAFLLSKLLFKDSFQRVWPIVSLILIFSAGLFGTSLNNQKLLSRKMYPQAQAYKEAQLWARYYTPQGSVFMVDPTIYYGWRDFSQRPSFGNLREWLYSSWLYDSNVKTYNEGLKRFEEFGLPLTTYLSASLPQRKFAKLNHDIQNAYYAMDDQKLEQLAGRYQIRYFLFSKANKRQHSTSLPIVYENSRFIVYEAKFSQKPSITLNSH